MSSTTTAGTYLILDAQTNWGKFYMTLSGNADFDEHVWSLLGTDYLTPNQAAYLWDYTDGYRMTIESTITLATANSAHCIKKTKSAITGAAYDSGSLCFETTYGGLQNVGYYSGIGSGTGITTSILQSQSKWAT